MVMPETLMKLVFVVWRVGRNCLPINSTWDYTDDYSKEGIERGDESLKRAVSEILYGAVFFNM